METTQRPLTHRQWAVLARAARGEGYQQIATALQISRATVDSRLEGIGLLLGATRLPAMIDCAYRQGRFAALLPEDRLYRRLPRRRQQVLEGLARGLTDGQLAAEMSVTEDTVGTHVTLLYRDLGARNRWHAVALGHQLGHLAR